MEERLGKKCQGAARGRKGTEGEEGEGRGRKGQSYRVEIISDIHIKLLNMFFFVCFFYSCWFWS